MGCLIRMSKVANLEGGSVSQALDLLFKSYPFKPSWDSLENLADR